MASGPVSRIDRPNTWLLRPALRRDLSLDSPEPSTHGPKPTNRRRLLWLLKQTFRAITSGSVVQVMSYRMRELVSRLDPPVFASRPSLGKIPH
jgi:hypothetical protein